MEADVHTIMDGLLIKEGIKLIDKLSSDKQLIDFEYILDIGCGTGNVTVSLNNISPNTKHIYAIDIDQNMIEYAKQHNCGENTIEYLVQDLSVEWNQFRPELKALEGKVTIIFTNLVLHSIYTKRDIAAENMSRLLSNEGKVYSTINYLPDISERFESRINKFILSSLAYIPTKEEQEKGWIESFMRYGLETIENKFETSYYQFDLEEFDQLYPSIGFGIYEQFYGKYFTNSLKMISSLYGPTPSSVLEQFEDETTGRPMCTLDCQSFLFVLQKHCKTDDTVLELGSDGLSVIDI